MLLKLCHKRLNSPIEETKGEGVKSLEESKKSTQNELDKKLQSGKIEAHHKEDTFISTGQGKKFDKKSKAKKNQADNNNSNVLDF